MLRRQDAAIEGDCLLAEGREAYAQGDYQQAVDKYTQAVQRVPDAPGFADRRQSYIDHLSDASIALSMQHRKVGKYSESRTLLEAVIAQDPNNAEAKRELSYLDDPIRTNPALDYEHTQNVDEVRKGLYRAEGALNLGKYDEAKTEYEKVLRVDGYNSAARRGLDRIAWREALINAKEKGNVAVTVRLIDCPQAGLRSHSSRSSQPLSTPR